MPYETLFVIRNAFTFVVSIAIFGMAAADVVVQALKARRRGESGWRAARRELRGYKVGLALAFGVILLTRSQVR